MEMPSRPNQQGTLGADVWVSVIIGLLMIFMGINFGKFLIARVSGQPYHTGVNWTEGPLANSANPEVAYFDLQGFTAWTDMGVFLFGLVLLLEAGARAMMAIRPGGASRLVLMAAIGLTFATVLLNGFVCFRLMSNQITPLISGLAVAFGGWILVDEWRMLRR